MSAVIRAIETELIPEVLEAARIELTPREARMLKIYRNMSLTTWIGCNNGELICVWGIVPPSLVADEVYLWLHTTGDIKASQFIFVRHSQLVIQDLLKEYRAITGHVSVHNPTGRRWLKWLGAEFGPAKSGMYPFRIERHG